jgi:ABC-type antimicrobial peptide transport system permease subunit
MALGATREGVAWMVLREVVRMAALGLLIGVPVAFAVGRFAEATLYGVKAGDPPAYALAAVFLGVLALLAGSLPARRATAVDPMVALRYE